MQKEPTDKKVVVPAQSDVIVGPWIKKVRIPIAQSQLDKKFSRKKSRHSKVWRDARLCSRCGSIMTSSHYRRQAIRYLVAYHCSVCSHRFEQETRGFQGFYWGCLLFFAVIATLLTMQRAFTPTHIFVLGVVSCLLLVPVVRNVKLSNSERVVVRFGGSRLLPSKKNKRLYGRILGGDSMLFGFLLAIGTVAFSLTAVFSAVITVSAVMV